VVQRHGWSLYAHPLFLDQLERLLASVERAKQSDPEGWRRKADAQTLGAIYVLVFDRIPRDPLAPEFRQGNILGKEHRHWFRAKFGGSRFRLFFRAHLQAKVIVFAWVNDRDTLRKAGASTDPYALFTRMLGSGNPPDGWPDLMAAAQGPDALKRFAASEKAVGGGPSSSGK
jgi:toxin YhaV